MIYTLCVLIVGWFKMFSWFKRDKKPTDTHIDYLRNVKLYDLQLRIYNSVNSNVVIFSRFKSFVDYINKVRQTLVLVNDKKLTGYGQMNIDLSIRYYLTDYFNEGNYITISELEVSVKSMLMLLEVTNAIKDNNDIISQRLMILTANIVNDTRLLIDVLNKLEAV